MTDTNSTVKQTIVESFEAPRLQGIDIKDFVSFKEKREIYDRKVKEKCTEQKIKIIPTSYRNSIDKSLLETFVIAKWVPETTVDSITEDSLKKCIDNRSTVDSDKYELALIEKQLSSLHLDTSVRTLENRIWKLCVPYKKILKELGYIEFIDKKPNLAVTHIMSRITYGPLKRRVNTIYRLNLEEYKKDFSLFMRHIAAEAALIDKADLSDDKKEKHKNKNEQNKEHRENNNNKTFKSNNKSNGKPADKETLTISNLIYQLSLIHI